MGSLGDHSGDIFIIKDVESHHRTSDSENVQEGHISGDQDSKERGVDETNALEESIGREQFSTAVEDGSNEGVDHGLDGSITITPKQTAEDCKGIAFEKASQETDQEGSFINHHGGSEELDFIIGVSKTTHRKSSSDFSESEEQQDKGNALVDDADIVAVNSGSDKGSQEIDVATNCDTGEKQSHEQEIALFFAKQFSESLDRFRQGFVIISFGGLGLGSIFKGHLDVIEHSDGGKSKEDKDDIKGELISESKDQGGQGATQDLSSLEDAPENARKYTFSLLISTVVDVGGLSQPEESSSDTDTDGAGDIQEGNK